MPSPRLLLAAASLALAPVAPAAPASNVTAPAPLQVVAPTNLPLSYAERTFTFEFVVDADGQPHGVTIVSPIDTDAARRLVPVIAQWRFRPALRDGVPVARRVQLPVKLVGGS